MWDIAVCGHYTELLLYLFRFHHEVSFYVLLSVNGHLLYSHAEILSDQIGSVIKNVSRALSKAFDLQNNRNNILIAFH